MASIKYVTEVTGSIHAHLKCIALTIQRHVLHTWPSSSSLYSDCRIGPDEYVKLSKNNDENKV